MAWPESYRIFGEMADPAYVPEAADATGAQRDDRTPAQRCHDAVKLAMPTRFRRERWACTAASRSP